jgi:hydrogenase maturation protease
MLGPDVPRVLIPRDGAKRGQDVRICVVGVGNEQRRDDGVGIWIVRQIELAGWQGVVVAALDSSDATALLSAWDGAKIAYVIDAAASNAEPGTLFRVFLRWPGHHAAARRRHAPVPTGDPTHTFGQGRCETSSDRSSPAGGPRFLSSHGLGVLEAIELGRVLGMLPDRLVVYGIVGRDFQHGQGLSPEVEHAAQIVIGRLRRASLATPHGRGKPRRA